MIKNAQTELNYILLNLYNILVYKDQINGHIKTKLGDIKTLTYVIKSFHMSFLNLKSSK